MITIRYRYSRCEIILTARMQIHLLAYSTPLHHTEGSRVPSSYRPADYIELYIFNCIKYTTSSVEQQKFNLYHVLAKQPTSHLCLLLARVSRAGALAAAVLASRCTAATGSSVNAFLFLTPSRQPASRLSCGGFCRCSAYRVCFPFCLLTSTSSIIDSGCFCPR